MKKGIIISLLLSLAFVQSAYCYKLTIINDTGSVSGFSVNRTPVYFVDEHLNPVKERTVEGKGCVTEIARTLIGKGYAGVPEKVVDIGGIPFDKAKAYLCDNSTIRLSTIGWKKIR